MIRRSIASIFLLLAVVVSAAGPAGAQGYPDEPGDGIADLAKVLAPADADTIRKVLYALREQPGIEVRLLTVRNVAGFGTGHATPEAFATAVYNEWKLGLGQSRDGVLVLLSVDDRFTRIELGDAAPAHLDAASRAIIDDRMVPRFRDGDMSGGLRDGVLALAASLAEAPAAAGGALPAASTAPTAEAPQPQPQGGYTQVPPWFGERKAPPLGAGAMLFIILMGGPAAFLVIRALASRRSCERCGARMAKLDGVSRDARLEPGQRLEAKLGSVSYAVWQCAGCEHHVVVRDPAMFTRQEKCTQCGYRTVGVTRRTVQEPTYTAGGRQEVEKRCAHCGWGDVEVTDLPRKQRPQPRTSTSRGLGGFRGGGGGGGSRGGHSSGRGSSGRW